MNVKVKVWRSMSKRQRYLLLLGVATYQQQKRIESMNLKGEEHPCPLP